MMSSYTLVYFELRGLAEAIRVMFALARIPFTDERIDYDNEWPAMKNSGRFPFGHVPVLEFGDGRTLCQSAAILRFLANKFGFSPSDDYQRARADMIVDVVKDLQLKVGSPFYEKDESKQAEMTSSISKDYIPPQMQFLDNVFQKNNDGKGYFVGNKITYADIAVFCFLNGYLAGGAMQAPVEIKNHPLLVDFYYRVMNEPNILEYLTKRKHCPFPDRPVVQEKHKK